MQNAIECLARCLAVSRCRATAVRIHFGLVAEELAFIVHDLDDASLSVLCLDGGWLKPWPPWPPSFSEPNDGPGPSR